MWPITLGSVLFLLLSIFHLSCPPHSITCCCCSLTYVPPLWSFLFCSVYIRLTNHLTVSFPLQLSWKGSSKALTNSKSVANLRDEQDDEDKDDKSYHSLCKCIFLLLQLLPPFLANNFVFFLLFSPFSLIIESFCLNCFILCASATCWSHCAPHTHAPHIYVHSLTRRLWHSPPQLCLSTCQLPIVAVHLQSFMCYQTFHIQQNIYSLWCIPQVNLTEWPHRIPNTAQAAQCVPCQ